MPLAKWNSQWIDVDVPPREGPIFEGVKDPEIPILPVQSPQPPNPKIIDPIEKPERDKLIVAKKEPDQIAQPPVTGLLSGEDYEIEEHKDNNGNILSVVWTKKKEIPIVDSPEFRQEHDRHCGQKHGSQVEKPFLEFLFEWDQEGNITRSVANRLHDRLGWTGIGKKFEALKSALNGSFAAELEDLKRAVGF